MRRWFCKLSRFANRKWFGLLLAFLSAVDAYIVFVPNEAILAAGVIAGAGRWLLLSIEVTVGSALGAASLVALIEYFNTGILNLIPSSVHHSGFWHESISLIRHHGVWGLALISLSPLPQHAAVVLVGLWGMPVWDVFIAVLLGRGIKYLITAWLAVNSPELLKRFHILPRSIDLKHPCS